jgi:hypothetical protein
MSDRVEIVEVLARYVRAMERRDGDALAELFTPDGAFALFGRNSDGEYVPSGADVIGRDRIRAMVEGGALPPHRGMQYLTTDHIVEIEGATASLEAQFTAVETDADIPAEVGWSTGARLLQGSLAVTMLGRYESELTKIDGCWLLAKHHVKHRLTLKSRAAS